MNKHYIINFLIIGLIGMLAINGYDGVVNRIQENRIENKVREITDAPTSDYFEYFAVNPEQDYFEMGEELVMLSDSVWHKVGDVRWNDILRCDSGNGFKFFSVYNTNADAYTPDQGLGIREMKPWRYGGDVPTEKPSVCYIDSTISFVESEHGIVKAQQIQSGPFFYE